MKKTDNIIRMSGINKSFGGIRALDNVTLSVKRGTCHGLLGENGAGKSTLMKILTGVMTKDSGSIFVNDQEVHLHNLHQAEKLGIAIIPQELSFISFFSVAENIFYGEEPRRSIPLFVNWKELYEKCQNKLEELKIELPPKTLAGKLNVSEQQMMIIARVLTKNADVIVMDEPTARLGHFEVEKLLEYVQYLKSCGKTIIYISHRLEEIFEVCDEVSVMRDGKLICTSQISELNEDKLVNLMVDRELKTRPIRSQKRSVGDVIFSVRGLCKKDVCKDVSFDVHKGEILGMFGLVGSGRTESIRAILGIDKCDSAEIYFNGKPVVFKSIKQALGEGIALVPEERRKQGILPNTSIYKNTSLSNLPALGRFGFINRKREITYSSQALKMLNVVFGSIHQSAGSLSGGNQQKVVISKYIARNVQLLILDEPTRGIDVGAKDQIYEIIENLVDRGMTAIIISSEIPELQLLCDRICVMSNGQIVKTFNRDEFASSDEILRNAIGI